MVKIAVAHPSQMPLAKAIAEAIEAPENSSAEAKLYFLLGALTALAFARGENFDATVKCIDRICRLVEFAGARNEKG